MEHHSLVIKLESRFNEVSNELPKYEDITDEDLNALQYDECINIFYYLFSYNAVTYPEKMFIYNIKNIKKFINHVIKLSLPNNIRLKDLTKKDFICNEEINKVLPIFRKIIILINRLPYNAFPKVYKAYFNLAKNIDDMSLWVLDSIHKELLKIGHLDMLHIDNFNINFKFIKMLPIVMNGESPLLYQFVQKYHDNREYMDCLIDATEDKLTFDNLMEYPMNISNNILINKLKNIYRIRGDTLDRILSYLNKNI